MPPRLAARSAHGQRLAELPSAGAIVSIRAHIGRWQAARTATAAPVKTLLDLRRAAVVHNLHVIARQPAAGNYQLAA
jgi:hypothetical protein